ncbi:phosphoribosyltransferase [Ignicoccus islandicus DSM 13165]|uniref:Phosphoribosyltransferase n=1 Tax=Ignicoccus islandicus DSM 13165 TaxID=940295 RepID=A0A0U3FHT0_9CREN|nr:phosphoribosyltransferase family protein [Ignicoccus islandicus]ALU11462.1 phosphoribosyltransferase [Ignicoccus islandicus DSM 13165]
MGRIVFDENLVDLAPVFKDRRDAGRKLGTFLKKLDLVPDLIFAIPAGGVPVALEACKTLRSKMDLIIVKKVLYPWTTEAGFGAVSSLDFEVADVGLPEEVVKRQIEAALERVREREKLFRKGRPYPDLTGLKVCAIDDGIAAGYTMRVAVRSLKKLGAEEVWACAPTSSASGAEAVAQVADLVVILNLRTYYPFAVADAYENWYDLSDEEVLELLGEAEAEGCLIN